MRLFLVLSILTVTSPLNAQTKPHVAVIGAGLAGLSAAYELEKIGLDVTVFEARKRLGGRVFTAYINNSYEELGGKCLEDGGDAFHIRKLVDELGLKIYRSELVFGELNSVIDSRVLKSYEVFRDPSVPEPTDAFYVKLRNQAQSSQSLAEIFDPFFPVNATLRKLINQRMAGYEGRSVSELSPYYLDSFWSYYSDSYEWAHANEKTAHYFCDHVQGGNSRLIKALARQLRGPVRFEMPLESIEMVKHSKALRLRFRDQSIFEYDLVVLAIPGSKYRDLTFADGLIPEDQREALGKVQLGTNAKMLVPVCIAQDETQMPALVSSFGWFNHDRSILTMYFGAEQGVFDMSPECLKEKLKRESVHIPYSCPSMEFTSGNSIQAMTQSEAYSGAVSVSWIHEEYSKGSYSSWGLGHDDLFNVYVEDLGVKIRKPFRSVDQRIFFAGEHTAVKNPSSMEGAAESGFTVAKQIETLQK